MSSQFMGKVKKLLNLIEKFLPDLTMNHPDAFKAVVEQVK
jgi:large subunit ribosomal protein L20